MEDWIQEHEVILYGIGFIVLGILGLLYMRYYGDTKESRIAEKGSPMSKSIRFNIYMGSIICILLGVFGLLRELFLTN